MLLYNIALLKCINWFKLVSQVSDVAHRPLVNASLIAIDIVIHLKFMHTCLSYLILCTLIILKVQ